MIEFTDDGSDVLLSYQPEDSGGAWAWHKLKTEGAVAISKVFHFQRGDLIEEPNEEQLEDDIEHERFTFDFRFGRIDGNYRRIEGRMFGIPNTVLIAAGIPLSRKLFAAHRDVSILRRVSKLIPADHDIVIGGDREDAIPHVVFEGFLKKFPGSTELDRYANARVADVLGEYFDGMKDARQNYETYMSRRKAILGDDSLGTGQLLELELEKYQLIRKTIFDWLQDAEVRTERDWQTLIEQFLLLIFPKYVAILHNVRIADSYSRPGVSGHRYIDLALVDAAGNLDVIEIKRPHGDRLLSNGRYRDNGVPTRELSGAIMQAEKYIFHLSKWGVAGEEALNRKYISELPEGMRIQVTNPKAILILGRDRDASGSPLLEPALQHDFEIIRRKYANVMDIMTYDDLLARLDNIIASLRKRIHAEIDI